MLYIGAMIDLRKTSEQLANMGAESRIQWARERFGDHLVLTTSFGTYSAVMLHLVSTAAPDTPIISVDTGHNEETVRFADRLMERLGLKVDRYRLPSPPEDPTHPPESPEEYLQRHKIDILEQALRKHGAQAWMSGVQRNETDHRRDFEFLMQRDDGLFKFHPLLDWDARQLYGYCKEHGLPVNDHYFDPAKGADQKQECGIHLTGMANESFTSSEL